MQGCVTCHGQSGQGTSNEYFPRIAGKPAAYLYNQLVAFRDGKREYPPMNYLVAYLPDAYLQRDRGVLRQAAAGLRSEASERRRRLRCSRAARRWPSPATPSKQLPACIACHGAGLTGMEPGIPGLVGPALVLHRRAAHALAHRRPAGGAARLHEAHRRPPDGGRRARRGRPGWLRRTRRPIRRRRRPTCRPCRSLAAARRQCHEDPMRKATRIVLVTAVVAALVAGGAFAILHARLPAGGAWRSGLGPDDADDQEGRVPGARRRLRRLPLQPRRAAVRRRAADAHALRQPLRAQHHARRRDRHRQMDRRRLLPDDAQRRVPGRHADVPGDAVCLVHQGDARGLRCHLRLPDVGAAGGPEEPAARIALSVQPARPADRLAHALLQAGRVRARHEQVGAMEPRRLPGRRPGPLRDVPHRDQPAWAAPRPRRSSRAA